MLKEKQTLLHLVTLLIISLNFTISSQSFLITKYSTDTGLPDNRINDIAQDSLGRIWVAMASGIAMYDGYEWIKYGEKNGVPEIEYVKIKIDNKGILWFLPKQIYNESLVYFNFKKWGKLSLKSKVNNASSYSNALEINYSNNRLQIYISKVTRGLLFYDNGEWEVIKARQGLVCDTITNLYNIDNKIYVSTFLGISILSENKIIGNIHSKDSNIKSPILGLAKILVESNNKTKIYSFGSDWIGILSDHKVKVHTLDIRLHSLGYNDSHFISNYKNKYLVFGNSSFLYSYSLEDNSYEKIILESPQSDRGGSSIFIDNENNIWVSSLRGIYKLTHNSFYNYTKSKNLPEIEVSAISQFNSGEIVFGHNYGVSILKGKEIIYHEIASPENTNTAISRITSIHHDQNSDLMYLTSVQGGILVLNRNGIVGRKRFSDVTRYTTTDSYITGGVIIFTDKGFYGIGNKIQYKIANSIMIRKAIIYSKNEYLLGSSGGVIKWNCETNNKILVRGSTGLNVFSLSKNINKEIFIGTLTGLYKLQADSIVKYKFNDQNLTEPIYFIIRDFSKNIWLGTNNGVLKWDGKYLKRYNKSDGLSGNETNRAAGFVDNKGNVWIGTDEGVSMYSGNEPDYSSFPPKAMILDLKDHTNLSYKINSNVSIDPDNNNLTFHYRGLSFINEKQNLFQIKLTDVDGDYKNEFITRSTSTRFNSVAAGDYIFSVRVQNSKGIWSEWKSSSVITVKEHFYNEPYFYVSVLGLFLFIAYTTNNYLQQKKYTKRLEHDVDVRTKDLRDTQEQLITSANRYKGIIESQSDLVIRITETGILTFVNDAYCAVFGKKREELIGKSFVPLVHPEDVEFTFEEMKKLNIPPYRSTLEQRALTIDGYRWFSWEGYAIHDHEGNVLEIQAVGRDITIQKEVETELEKRVNERTIELQSLIAQSPLGILTFDSDGYLITYNKIASEMFYSLKEYAPPKKDFNLFKDYYLVKNNYSEKLLALDQPNSFILTSPIFIDDPQNKVYKKLLNHYLVYRIYNVHFDEVHEMFVLLVDDVTEQQNTEEVSKRLLEEKIRISTIFKTIESERERFAKELHDGLGQLLTTAKLKLDIIKIKSDKSITEINDTVNILINAGDEIRRIISDLKPADVERFGLDSSIELLVERIRQNTSKKILLSILTGIQIQNKNIEIVVYRIVQEALNNMVKYSQCNNAMVELSSTNNELQLKISDDGIGFDMTKQDEKFKSYGINNIKERVSSLNGKIEIKSEPGKGFSYHIIIPL